jgi:hypothetical protein
MTLPKDVRVHVLMDAPMYEQLRQINAETGAPVGEIIRRAIQAHLTPARESRIVGSPAPVLIPGRETR